MIERVSPACGSCRCVENVGALAHLPDLLETFYVALERNRGVAGPADSATSFRTSFTRP